MTAELRLMTGKVCVVTGATDGIGKETALGLAKLGATVLIVARNASKAMRTVEEIARGSDNEKVEWVRADFASLEEVRAAAAEIARRFAGEQRRSRQQASPAQCGRIRAHVRGESPRAISLHARATAITGCRSAVENRERFVGGRAARSDRLR